MNRLARKGLSMALALGLLGLAGGSWADWKSEREALDQRHVQEGFRIHYTLRGEHALNPATGGGKSGQSSAAAALVAQIGEQMVTADRFYSQELGLTPPAFTRRYQPQGMRYVDVHMLRMEDKKGSTGDEIVTYRYRKFKDHAPAMTISISTDWRPPGVTPQHEVFHTYQYAYTYFKNAWFLEGMARSVEGAFGNEPYLTEPLPADRGEIDRLLARTYSASRFWNRLMALCDPGCVTSWDGMYFRGAAPMCGGGFVKAVLEEFQSLDPLAAMARGRTPDNWPESEQWSADNNPWMLRGVRQAMDRQCPIGANSELTGFRALLTSVVGN